MINFNRTVVLIKPKEPFLEWLKGLPDPETMMELKLLRNESTALLIPDFSCYEKAKEYIYEHADVIFESELNSWHEDKSDWPKNRDLKMFNEWFDIEIHERSIEMVDKEYRRNLKSSGSAELK